MPYNFDKNLPELEKGEKQYKDIHKNLINNSQVSEMIKQFEDENKYSEDKLDLSPEIENFLKDLEDN